MSKNCNLLSQSSVGGETWQTTKEKMIKSGELAYGQVPCLMVDGVPHVESQAIMRYLART